MKQWKIALRSIARRPGFTIAVIAILALGIGADTALFSVVDTILLKPLPFPHADRLAMVMEASPAKNQKVSLIAPARLGDWNRLNQSFEAISASYSESVTDSSGAEPERLSGRRVAPRFFDVFGMAPVAGRTFTPDEEQAGGPLAVVISHGLWTRRYGQDRNVTNRRLVLGGKGYSIVGVMPREFSSPAIDLWIPSQINAFLMRVREARFYSGVGRMKAGVTMEQARADLDRVQRALGEQFPQTDRGWSATVGDLKEYRVGDYRQALLLVFGAVGLLLLISVTNVAGLMLAQLQRRERELAIRSSLGASRSQVVGAVMREVVLIALTGAALGCAAAAWGTTKIAAIFADLPRISELHYDWRAGLFASVVSLVAALLFGLPPALQATRAQLSLVLSQSSRSVGGRHRWQQALLVTQVAITVLLLSSAGLLLRSYYNLNHVDSGFNPSHAVTFHVGAAWDEDRARIGRLQEQIVAALQRFPGVEAAGITNFLPASNATLRYEIQLEGSGMAAETGKALIGGRSVSAGYLKALQIPLQAGESCPDLRVDFNAPLKALVNRRFVDVYGRGQNLLGRHFHFPGNDPRPREIVGILGDVREDNLAASPFPFVYDCIAAGGWPDPEYVARTRGDSQALTAAVRKLVHELDPSRAVFGIKMVEDLISDSLEQPRLSARMLTVFAAAAMVLASIGLYGLVTLLVAARTRDIGIRMALGATRSRILGSVLIGAAQLVGAGAAAGIGLTILAVRLLRTVVFGVSPYDGLTMAGAVLALASVSAIAAFLPARRAAAIDPIKAIRAE